MKKFFIIQKFIHKKKKKNKKSKNKRYDYKNSKLDNENCTTLYDSNFDKESYEEDNSENNNSICIINFNEIENTYVSQELCPVNIQDIFANFDTGDAPTDSTNVSTKK